MSQTNIVVLSEDGLDAKFEKINQNLSIQGQLLSELFDQIVSKESLVNKTQAAILLGISRPKLDQLIAEGVITPTVLGMKTFRFKKEEILKLRHQYLKRNL